MRTISQLGTVLVIVADALDIDRGGAADIEANAAGRLAGERYDSLKELQACEGAATCAEHGTRWQVRTGAGGGERVDQ